MVNKENRNVSEVRGRKDMKNREKYKNELMDVIKTDGRICGFVKKHEVFRMFGTYKEGFCGEMGCVDCATALQLWLLFAYSVCATFRVCQRLMLNDPL